MHSYNILILSTFLKNQKVIQDFIVQGTLIGNQRRQLAAHASKNSPNIIINCDDSEYDECDTYAESTLNMFQNINSDLLLSLDYYEMDSLGRLPGKSFLFRMNQIFMNILNFSLSTYS